MKRVTLLVDATQAGDSTMPSHTVLIFDNDAAYLPTSRVESIYDIPELPTEPGTHIVATVTRYDSDGCYPVSERTVLALIKVAGEACWRSAMPVRSQVIHDPRCIHDWQILTLPDGGAQ